MGERVTRIAEIPITEGLAIQTSHADELRASISNVFTADRYTVDVDNTVWEVIPFNQQLELLQDRRSLLALLETYTRQLAQITNPQDALDAVTDTLNSAKPNREAALRSLTRLEGVLPDRQRQVASLHTFVSRLGESVNTMYRTDQQVNEAAAAFMARFQQLNEAFNKPLDEQIRQLKQNLS